MYISRTEAEEYTAECDACEYAFCEYEDEEWVTFYNHLRGRMCISPRRFQRKVRSDHD